MRLICPAPTPSVMPYRQNTIALDFTYLATRKAKMRSFISSSVGLRLVTTRNSDRSKSSAVCTSRPPPTRFISNLFSSRASGICSTRTFCLALKTCRAAALNDGANTTSTNCFDTSSAVAPSTSRLNAMIPPNADVGSVSSARWYAVKVSAAIATPHGLACLTITHTGTSNDRAHSHAASASATLL